MGIFSTSAFAVLATDIFKSGVNVGLDLAIIDLNGYGGEIHGEKDNELVGGTIAATNCVNNGVSVPCTMTGIGRVEAPYTSITPNWPSAVEFASAPNITVPKKGTLTIDPGVYNTISVEGSGKNHGQLIMNPGVYWINEYHVKGQALPGGTEGTVVLLIKSELNFAGSSINCTVGSGNIPNEPYDTPNRFVFYTEDLIADVNDASISGYVYLKYALKQAQLDLWGAISAASVTLQKGSHIYVDLEHLIFADFAAFLEVGPKKGPGWHMVKAPAEINATNQVTVADFLGDDLNMATYGTEWVVFQRDYDGTRSFYTELALTTPLEKNRGYWLGLTQEAEVKVLGLNPVTWDDTIPGCTSDYGCYRYTLQSCSAGDTNPSLYNLVGSVGSTDSDWADYRVEVDNNGTVMTPSRAMEAGIINKQIWKYIPNGSLDSANSGEYLTADDSGLLGDSTVDYFDGFWVEVNCSNSVGKTIDLIVPNRM